MNDKKDDSEGRYEPGDDTASLLESLFKDTKSSQIKVVRRRIHPKSSRVKKRVLSKKRKDEGKEIEQTPSQKQRRPSPLTKGKEAVKSKILSRKRSLPSSVAQKDAKTEQSRQKSHQKSTADAKPTFKPSQSDDKRIVKPGAPIKEKPPSQTIAGPGEERTESLDQSVLNSMISMASGIKGSRKSPLLPDERQRLETKKGGGEKTSDADDLRTGLHTDIEEISGTDEEITEVMGKTTIDSMLSELEGSEKDRDDKVSAKGSSISEEEEEDAAEIFFDGDDLGTGTTKEIERISGMDDEITEVLEKATLDSMISALEESGKEGDNKVSAKGSSISEEEEEGSTEIFFDEDDLRAGPPEDIEGLTGEDDEITEVLEKSVLNTMISALEGSGKKGDDKAPAKESPVPEGETGIGTLSDNGDLKEETASDIEDLTGGDDEITEVLEKSALNTMISVLEESGKEGDEKASLEKSSASDKKEVDVGIAIDSDDVKEEVSTDSEGIDRATEDELFSQEKPAAPSLLTIEDSLPEASAHEAYPESTLEGESIPKDRKETVEEAPQTVDPKEKQPSDSVDAELIKEKTLIQEKTAASTPIPSKVSGTGADVFELHHILEDHERPIVESKKESVGKISEVVDQEIEPPSDSLGPVKEESRFQETPIPSIMSSEDSMVNTDEDEHHRQADIEEPVPKREEDDIERVSESADPLKEESSELDEDITLTEEELQIIGSSQRRSKVIRIGLPLVLFVILAVILSIQYSPRDFFRHEQAPKLVSDKSGKVSSPEKKEMTPEKMGESTPATRQAVQPPTPTLAEKEIVRAPVPRKQDATQENQKETVSSVTPKAQPSTSEPQTILAMKEDVKGPSPLEQNTIPKASKEDSSVTDQKIRPEPPEPPASPSPKDAAAKTEANGGETSTLYPYSVYLGSYSTLENAEKAVSKYKENGFSFLYWQEVDLGDKGIWYRVFTGQFKTKNEAEEYIKEQRLVDAEVRKTGLSASISSSSVKDPVSQVKVPEKQTPPPNVTAGSSYPYSVYIGSYKDLARARKATSDLQIKGASYWVKTDLGDKGIWYRVYIGYFQTRVQAETFIHKHQIADGESRRTTYANLIGTYNSQDELEKMRLSLLNLEFSPYVIEASDGQSHLFTGAYYQKARAEKEHHDLQAKGIQSQLVER